MWKRLKPDQKPPSDGLSPAPSAFSLDEPTTYPPPDSIDYPQYQSLPNVPLAVRSGVATAPRRASPLSDIQDHALRGQQLRPQDRRDDPLGLFVLHTPQERTVDIIFVHGLGGTSLRTWCRDRDLNNLWPRLWLPHEIPTARILTFGYNSHFGSKREQTSYTISDFASDFLFRLKYGENTPERLGQVPIIVVAHSMGGLVFKKAFTQGHLNDEFRGIVSMIRAVLFLATPHHGTDLAKTLNRLLSGSVFGHSSKGYVLELARKSPTIDELNESFQRHARHLQIFSFYETVATAMGLVSVMIVDKSSAVMGYPNETSTPLNADHHNVCKFTSTEDSNYTSVVGALRSIVASLATVDDDPAALKQDLQHLTNLLGIYGPPEQDLASGLSSRKQGTCEGFISSEGVVQWLQSKSRRILWANALPGSGKSTACSFLIEHLLDTGHRCSYFFFKHSEPHKRSSGAMLRSLAYQMALQIPAFRQALVQMARSGTQLSAEDGMAVWKTLFLNNFARLKVSEELYWIIDGVDESEPSKQVVEVLAGVADFESQVRVLVFGRPLAHIGRAFQLAKKKLPVVDMPLPANEDDIRLMVAEEFADISCSESSKAEAVNEIVARSQGCFLWASLVAKKVASLKCHSEEQVEDALDRTPNDMERLYSRMLDTVTNLEVGQDKILARIFLTWAMYAKAPVSIHELEEVYPRELKSIMDLNHTVSQVCGQFVVVDPQDRVVLVHQSAREYLQKQNTVPFSPDSEHANEDLFGKCMVALCDKALGRKISMSKIPQFLPYASTSWAVHLGRASTKSGRILDALLRFFNGPYPLAWIQFLAINARLAELANVSQSLMTYVRKRGKECPDDSPSRNRLADLSLIKAWALDLMKLSAKFGRHLSEDPALIYRCIPALSPADSVLHRKFAENPSASLSVSGLSDRDWDDCIVRVSGGAGQARRLATSPLYFAVASDIPRGTVSIWSTSLFEEHKTLELGEHVWDIAFSKSGSLLVCYAISKTFVWKAGDWSLELSTENPRHERAIELRFDEDDNVLMISEHRRVYKLPTRLTKTACWEQLDPNLLVDPGVPEDTFLGTPSCVVFSNDCTQIAVAYRSFPLSIWNVDPPKMTSRLRRKTINGQRPRGSHTGNYPVAWHPSGTEVIGIYDQVFKWSTVGDGYQETEGKIGDVVPHEIKVSPNGRVFLTVDVRRSIKIYSVSSLSLIYTLTSEDRINRICFGPDNVRFYDLRGSYCNIWEPDCLLRLADVSAQRASNAESTAGGFWFDTEDDLSNAISFLASERHVYSQSPLTGIEPGRTVNDLIAHANVDGSLNVYDTLGKKRVEITRAMFKMAIEQLAWSPKSDRLAYSVTNGATTVRSVTVDNSAQRIWSMEVMYAENKSPADRGRTLQLLFDRTGDRLLVAGAKTCQVLSPTDGAVLAEHTHHDGGPVKWRQHPSHPEHLLGLTARSVSIFSWERLSQGTTFPLDLADSPGERVDVAIDAILDSHSPGLLLLRTATMQLKKPRYGVAVLETKHLNPEPASATNDMPVDSCERVPGIVAKLRPIPPSLASAVAHAVGILPDGRLVFLDRQLWVCTSALTPAPDVNIARHFFLPHDWVTTQDLRLCRLLRDGTVLCPTKGEVAVMRGDLVREW